MAAVPLRIHPTIWLAICWIFKKNTQYSQREEINRMPRHLLTVFLLLAVLWGCSSNMQSSSGGASDPSSNKAESFAAWKIETPVIQKFHDRLDSVITLFYFGNLPDFHSAKDSLHRDIDDFAQEYPRAVEDSDFIWIRSKLNRMDTLLTVRESQHPYLDRIDSLALSYSEWPENDIIVDEFFQQNFEDTIFPAMRNRRIDFWIRYFTGPGRKHFGRSLYRMELYRPTIEPILEELNLPKDLIIVALIESGFNLKAKSRAKAVGPWQFIRGTAKIYGMRMNWWFDERHDIVASTYAAGNYLNDLYKIWNSWFLALAAYNCGEYRVARAIARQRTENFWKLDLPRQTERYVPKFLAAMYIAREPDKYGFKIPVVVPIKFDHVKVHDATDLKLIATSADVSVQAIKDLNPALLRWCTPPKAEIHVKVPHGTGARCETALAAIPLEERVTWRQHRVRKGETLSHIARKYGTTASALKSLNGIQNSHRIREGWTLIVPMMGSYAEVASTKPSYKDTHRNIDKKTLESYAKKTAPPTNYKKVIYRVKDGDTLGEIAEEFNTSARKLRDWNGLSYRSYIFPGQKLVIYVSPSFVVKEAPVVYPQGEPGGDMVKSQYTVKKGDTLYSISKRFRVRVSDLLTWNGKGRSSLIHPGEVLDIWHAKKN
jgi:membrane-bound lytic murein transglycosylase D